MARDQIERRHSRKPGGEPGLALVASAVLGGMESLYLATHSTVVTALGATLVAMITVAVLVIHKISR